MKKEWIELGALALGGLALFIILNRGGSSSPVPSNADTGSSTTPNYLSYNQGGNSPPTDNNALNLPAFAGSNGGACNCGSTANIITFADNGSFAQTLGQGLGIDLQAYESNVLSQFPDYVRQFFNAKNAADLAEQASTRFASLGQ